MGEEYYSGVIFVKMYKVTVTENFLRSWNFFRIPGPPRPPLATGLPQYRHWRLTIDNTYSVTFIVTEVCKKKNSSIGLIKLNKYYTNPL